MVLFNCTFVCQKNYGKLWLLTTCKKLFKFGCKVNGLRNQENFYPDYPHGICALSFSLLVSKLATVSCLFLAAWILLSTQQNLLQKFHIRMLHSISSIHHLYGFKWFQCVSQYMPKLGKLFSSLFWSGHVTCTPLASSPSIIFST